MSGLLSIFSMPKDDNPHILLRTWVRAPLQQPVCIPIPDREEESYESRWHPQESLSERESISTSKGFYVKTKDQIGPDFNSTTENIFNAVLGVVMSDTRPLFNRNQNSQGNGHTTNLSCDLQKHTMLQQPNKYEIKSAKGEQTDPQPNSNDEGKVKVDPFNDQQDGGSPDQSEDAKNAENSTGHDEEKETLIYYQEGGSHAQNLGPDFEDPAIADTDLNDEAANINVRKLGIPDSYTATNAMLPWAHKCPAPQDGPTLCRKESTNLTTAHPTLVESLLTTNTTHTSSVAEADVEFDNSQAPKAPAKIHEAAIDEYTATITDGKSQRNPRTEIHLVTIQKTRSAPIEYRVPAAALFLCSPYTSRRQPVSFLAYSYLRVLIWLLHTIVPDFFWLQFSERFKFPTDTWSLFKHNSQAKNGADVLSVERKQFFIDRSFDFTLNLFYITNVVLDPG